MMSRRAFLYDSAAGTLALALLGNPLTDGTRKPRLKISLAQWSLHRALQGGRLDHLDFYGGSTTSVLVNIPGEAASVITCMDGHKMALQGRAGPALGMAAFGSFIAGTVGIFGLMFFATPLSRFALKFGPHEYFPLIILGLTFVTYLSHGSMLKAVMMACFGLMMSNIGLDPITSTPRITFGVMELFEGMGIAPVAMGLFGVGEVLFNLERKQVRAIVQTKIRQMSIDTASTEPFMSPPFRPTAQRTRGVHRDPVISSFSAVPAGTSARLPSPAMPLQCFAAL